MIAFNAIYRYYYKTVGVDFIMKNTFLQIFMHAERITQCRASMGNEKTCLGHLLYGS